MLRIRRFRVRAPGALPIWVFAFVSAWHRLHGLTQVLDTPVPRQSSHPRGPKTLAATCRHSKILAPTGQLVSK